MSDTVIQGAPPSLADTGLTAPPLRCSVGVMAYNEAGNIGLLLDALCDQHLDGFTIEEIIVVASGCTDDTEDVVRRHCWRDGRIRLLTQARREGKASAINLFLREARGDVLVLESADTLPARDTLARLVTPFSDPTVGMTGARPRPVDPSNTLMGYSSHFLWWMHHTLALRNPKLGEMVAFRNSVKSIPDDTAVDEAAIEAAIVADGYRICYSPHAIVMNKGPESVRDYLVQRRRIIAGHKHLARTQGYAVSSTHMGPILRAFGRKMGIHARVAARLAGRRRFRFLLKYVRHHFVQSVFVGVALGLEAFAHALGAYDFHVRKRNPFIWEVARSTKRLR